MKTKKSRAVGIRGASAACHPGSVFSLGKSSDRSKGRFWGWDVPSFGINGPVE
jgi:hypothetical protein